MEYNVDYFIKKFEKIPENEWCVGSFKDGERKCALGFCGLSDRINRTEEGAALEIVFGSRSAACINDGDDRQYQQPTPKQRILAALNDIKNQITP